LEGDGKDWTSHRYQDSFNTPSDKPHYCCKLGMVAGSERYVPSKDHISLARYYMDQLPRKGVPVRKVETAHDRDRLYGGSPPKVTLTVLPRGISIC
jgi:hypothetical protein